MRGTSFGSLTSPMGGMGIRPRLGLPRMTLGRRGMGVPSLSSSSLLKFAGGGLVNHPSMTYTAIEDGLHMMPRHMLPDYMLSRMAEGGNVSAAAGRRAMRMGYLPHAAGFPHMADGGDPLDYVTRLQARNERLMDDITSMPIKPKDMHGTFTRRPDMPNFSPLADRFEQAMMMREAEEPSDLSSPLDPSDIPMMFSAAKGPAGLLSPGPLMGGLAAALYARETSADDSKPPRLAERFDPRVIAAPRQYSPLGAALRKLLGAHSH